MIMMMMMIIPPFYRKKKFHNESKTKLSVFILFFDVKSFPTKTFELSCKIYLFIQIRQKEAYNNSNINKKNSYIQHILRINIRWPINGLCVFHIKRYLKLCLSCKFFFSLFIHSFAAILRGVKSQDTNYKITDDGDGSKFSQRTNGRSPSCKKLMWIK